MKNRITDLLKTEYPIIQGGMAWVAEHNLAAAVSNAGGLGIIGAASAPAEVVREIRLKHACTLLVTTNINLSELAINVGLKTAENFSNIFKDKYGMTPLEYRLKNTRS